jgi:ABC-type lipoprotein export system ATPase subunit
MIAAELRNITKEYIQGAEGSVTRVLDNISLAIHEGETIAITGPSGSGKTTLLNILGTLDKPTTGEVLIHEAALSAMDENQLALLRNRHIGFVFQLHQLLPQLTIVENVLLPVLPVHDKAFRAEAGLRAHTLLGRVGLQDHLRKYPSQLSVGECQRVAVVRALINKPRLLLADEPTGSLDAHTAMALTDLLAELQPEHDFALVLVTHDPVVAGKMHKTYRLMDGKLHLQYNNING